MQIICQRLPPSRRIQPAVDVSARGIMSTNAVNPTVMKRRLLDVFQHLREIEEFVEPDVSGEVQAAVEKREQAEHAAEADQFGQAQQLFAAV